MQSIKGRGVERELTPFKRRVGRSFAMGRISKTDYDYINSRLEEVEARVVTMREIGHKGEEVLEP